MTKTYRIWFWILAVLSFLLCVGPLAAYSVSALIAADLVIEKVALASTVFIVLIMSVVSWLNKIALRSRLWIILIGLYICLDSIMTPLIIIAACQVIDEIIVCPIKNNLSTKLTISKELDKRLSIGG